MNVSNHVTSRVLCVFSCNAIGKKQVKPCTQWNFFFFFFSLTYLPMSEQSFESADTAARLKLPPEHPLATSEEMHRQMMATAQIKPAKVKQHTTHGLYLAIRTKLFCVGNFVQEELLPLAAQCAHTRSSVHSFNPEPGFTPPSILPPPCLLPAHQGLKRKCWAEERT